MDEIFNLDDYKSHLINYYHWQYDFDKYSDRSSYINKHYSDSYLNKIIDDTKNFIFILLQKMKKENKIHKNNIFCEIELSNDEYGIEKSYIINGCHGGWHSDTLFFINEKAKRLSISKYLVEKIFNDKFRIELTDKDFEYFNPDQEIGYEYSIPIFFISGPLAEFNKIYFLYNSIYNDELIKKQQDLILVLKKLGIKK